MPVLEHKDGGRASFDTMAEADAALKSGEWLLPKGENLQFDTGAGLTFQGGAEQMANVPFATGAAVAPTGRDLPAAIGAVEERAWNSPADRIRAFGEGAASSLTFGLSDAAGAALGSDVKQRAEHTAGRGAGEIAGIIASMVAPLPKGGGLAKLAESLPATALSRAAGRAGTVAGRVALAGAEGAAMGAGNVLSQVALSDPGLTAESLAANAGNFAQGMLLGTALGVGGGLLGEGASAWIAKRAAKTPAQVFSKGVGKEAATELAAAHNIVDGLADEVQASAKLADKEALKLHQQAVKDFEGSVAKNAADLHAGRDSVLRESLGEIDAALTKSTAKFSDETANEIGSLADDLRKLNSVDPAGAGQTAGLGFDKAARTAWKKYNELAPFVGLESIPRAALQRVEKAVANNIKRFEDATLDAADRAEIFIVDPDLANFVGKLDALKAAQFDPSPELAKLLTRAQKSPKSQAAMNYLKAARGEAESLGADDIVQMIDDRIGQYTESAKHVDDFVKTQREQLTPKVPEPTHVPINRTAAREAAILREGEKMTPAAMQRMLSQPDGLDRLVKLGRYYDEVAKAAAGNPVAKLQYDDAIKRIAATVDNVLSPEAKAAMTPEAIATMLGLGGGAEVIDKIVDLPEPVHRMLQLAALYKGFGGMTGLKVRAASGWRRIARSMARHAAAASSANAVWHGAAGDALEATFGRMGRAAGAGAAASLGTAALDKAMARKLGAVKAAASQTDQVKSVMSDMVINGLGKGKPPATKELRVLPGVHKVLDKLIGDPELIKGKTEHQKFTIVQERLSQFATSPQSVMDGIYHGLKPVQEASEQVADMMETTLGAQFEYAYETMPKDPGTMVSFGKSQWQPTDRALYEWSTHLAGAFFPLETLGALVSGSVPPQAVACLAKTNPAIYNEFVRNVIENGETISKNATYDQKIALGLALQIPVEPTTDPQYVAFIQNSHVESTLAAAAGPTQDKSSPEDDYSDAQKLLS